MVCSWWLVRVLESWCRELQERGGAVEDLWSCGVQSPKSGRCNRWHYLRREASWTGSRSLHLDGTAHIPGTIFQPEDAEYQGDLGPLFFRQDRLGTALTCDVGMGFQLSPPLVDECQHVRWHLYCRDTQEHYRVEAEEEELSSIITAGPGVPLSRHVKNRVAKIDGMSVRSAVSKAKYTKDGQSVLYKKADFKWDLGHNYIHLVPS